MERIKCKTMAQGQIKYLGEKLHICVMVKGAGMGKMEGGGVR